MNMDRKHLSPSRNSIKTNPEEFDECASPNKVKKMHLSPNLAVNESRGHQFMKKKADARVVKPSPVNSSKSHLVKPSPAGSSKSKFKSKVKKSPQT
jgi:hypothetical protein